MPGIRGGVSSKHCRVLLCDLRRYCWRFACGRVIHECMTPEITDPAVRAIAEEIAANPANASYTKARRDLTRCSSQGHTAASHDHQAGAWTHRQKKPALCGTTRRPTAAAGWASTVAPSITQASSRSSPWTSTSRSAGKSGDLAPRKDFADKWHRACSELMPHLDMTSSLARTRQTTWT